jgi:hypothetical protein
MKANGRTRSSLSLASLHSPPGFDLAARQIVLLRGLEPNSRNIETVSAIANQVSAEKIWIWKKIPGWRLGAEIGGFALDECNFAVAETDVHSRKSRRSEVFSQNPETPPRDRTGWLTIQSTANRSPPQIPC